MPVVLLCHCDGTNGSTTFTDTSGLGRALTASNATVSTASPKFGTGSGDFTAVNTAFVSAGYSPDFNFGAGPFTVEAWAYFTATPSGVQAVLSQWDSGSNNCWWLGMNAGSLQFFYSVNGTAAVSVAGVYTPTLNTWIHLAADRDAGNTLRIYANGAVISSAAAAATLFASTRNCLIGNDSLGPNRAFPGRLDDVRITKGTAQYGGAFTAPTSPFTNPSPLSATNTSWNPADKTASIALADLNLTAIVTASNQGVRAVNSQVTGKYYFEVTAAAWTGGTQGLVGIANASASLSGVSGVTTNAALVFQLGTIFMNGANAPGSPTLGTRANGDIIGVAVDLTNTLIWFRVAPSGNWNGNAGFAPGGTGGINFAAIGGGATAVFPLVGAAFATASFTANFGDSAFSGAVPAGFTAGWTIAAGGAVAASQQARAMVLA